MFLLQDNAITFLRLKSLKKYLVFHDLSYVLKHKQEIYFLHNFFFFLAYKTLRAIVTLVISNYFQSSFSDQKYVPSQLYLFTKGLNFVILCRFNATVTTY